MSDGFMADPIRPGDMNSQSSTPINRNNMSRNNSGAAKFVVIIFAIVFLAPLIMSLFVFMKVWDSTGSDIFQQLKGGVTITSGYYELSDAQQMAVARIFSTGTLYANGGPKTIAQGDCRHFKNAVMGYYNKNSLPASWYDNGYCEAGEINLSVAFLDENGGSSGGALARIYIDSAASNSLGCVSVTFAQNFRYISGTKSGGRCAANKVEIKADDSNIPELESVHDASSDDDDAEIPPIDKNILRS